MAKMTYLEAQRWASLFLSDQQLDESAATYLLQELSGLDQTHLLLHYRKDVPEALLARYQAAIRQYAAGTPPQYIVGTAPFYGRSFKVDQNVLIPRQETEELVEWALAILPQTSQRILDVGTGSGAIGLSLKAERPAWQVTLSDLSEGALGVARQNATALGLDVTFKQGDLLQPVTGQTFDAIISNPPYIDPEEASVMDADVLASEPRMALFADHHGLALYEQLAAQLATGVATTHHLFLEYGFQQREALTALFEQRFPTATVTARQDIAGHDRMLHVAM